MTGEREEKDGDYTIRPRIWIGRDGQPRCSFEVRARHVEFLSVSGGGGGQLADEEDDVIPF